MEEIAVAPGLRRASGQHDRRRSAAVRSSSGVRARRRHVRSPSRRPRPCCDAGDVVMAHGHAAHDGAPRGAVRARRRGAPARDTRSPTLRAAVERGGRGLARRRARRGRRPTLERPQARPSYGDYSTNAAHAARAGAERAAARGRRAAGRRAARAASARRWSASRSPGPGFLNLFLSDAWYVEALDCGAGRRRRASAAAAPTRPERVNVEFVSANPTGPLHGGQRAQRRLRRRARAAARRSPATTSTREYYFNDYGTPDRRSSASRSGPGRAARRCPRAATRATTSASWPAQIPGAADVRRRRARARAASS